MKHIIQHELPVSLGIVTNSLTSSAGGLFYSIREPRFELLRNGMDIVVYGVEQSAGRSDLELWKPLRIKPLKPVGPTRFGYTPTLSRELAAGRHDIVHLHGIWTFASIAVQKWGGRSGKPTVVSTHGMLDPWALLQKPLRKTLASRIFEHKALESASCLHALSDAEAESMRQFGLRKPIAILPNGFNSRHQFQPKVSEFRSFGLDVRRVVLFLGRIHPKKGLTQLVDAWALVNSQYCDVARAWRLVIAGWDDGGHLAQLERQVTRLKLENDVSFAGPVFGADKDAMLSGAGAFILPSLSEGLPMSVLEAWSHELPVVMTRMCNFSDAFSRDAAVEISTEPIAIAATLARTLKDNDCLRVLGLNGRALAEEKYSWPTIAGDFIKLYDWLLGRTVRPPFIH